MNSSTNRPTITEYQDLIEYVADQIAFRKNHDPGFSVHAATKSLRKVSPALVSLVLKRKRKLTLDRSEEFAKLLALNPIERSYFKRWIARIELGPDGESTIPVPLVSKERKEASTHILTDWLNVYVKDFFQIPEVRANPEILKQLLSHLVTSKRVQRSIDFLLREGHLRRTLSGSIEIEANLVIGNPKVTSQKIRQFHKSALGIAKQALDIFPPQERLANTMIITLNENSYLRLQDLIGECQSSRGKT
jgi:uncharacterized protein (TIGR02147 family)